MRHLFHKANKWYKSGTPMVWVNAGFLALSLLAVSSLLLLIAFNGLTYFWPRDTLRLTLTDNTILLGEHFDTITQRDGHTQWLIKTGNRDLYGSDFQLISTDIIASIDRPEQAVVVERLEWGNFYGFLTTVSDGDTVLASGDGAYDTVLAILPTVHALLDDAEKIKQRDISTINSDMEDLRLEQRRAVLAGRTDDTTTGRYDALMQSLDEAQKRINALRAQAATYTADFVSIDGQRKRIALDDIVMIEQNNQLSWASKVVSYVKHIWRFVSEPPREANTEGGIFPAIFGTVLMVILMSILVTPMGIMAAIYLHEYAKQGIITRLIRIAVNNLAGVPSVVYGVFGLGFFVYFIGGAIDNALFAERLPAPTFGTPGLLWSSLTLALLTLPVVIVSTEEGLSRIPKALREGSLALGATRFETLWKVILPMASPAFMTGLILAVARAAGEVAPLMLVGVVKLAPTLAIDATPPFLHLDRKFMHLGFHIYDLGFQSPNIDATRPLVYATSLLLVLVIIVLNLTAIRIRNRLRERYRALDL